MHRCSFSLAIFFEEVLEKQNYLEGFPIDFRMGKSLSMVLVMLQFLRKVHTTCSVWSPQFSSFKSNEDIRSPPPQEFYTVLSKTKIATNQNKQSKQFYIQFVCLY